MVRRMKTEHPATARFREMEGDLSYRVGEVLHVLWRNLPIFPSTFGPCPAPGCGNLGRGGYICADCAERVLADITGDPDTAAFIHHYAAVYQELVKKISKIDN